MYSRCIGKHIQIWILGCKYNLFLCLYKPSWEFITAYCLFTIIPWHRLMKGNDLICNEEVHGFSPKRWIFMLYVSVSQRVFQCFCRNSQLLQLMNSIHEIKPTFYASILWYLLPSENRRQSFPACWFYLCDASGVSLRKTEKRLM